MNIDEELGHHTPAGESVLTIGVFDGVHLGHRYLITHLKTEASRTGRLAGVVTFRNHPASVLRPNLKPRFLSTFDERIGLIRSMGVDFIAPITFDLELSKLPSGQFTALLEEHLLMKGLIIGPDFAMGHRREGDSETLAAIGRDTGFVVRVVEPLLDDNGQAIRSTVILEALARGDIEQVTEQTGRNFIVTGMVVKGSGRGGPMGFPTANLEASKEIAMPGDGIYATWAHIGPRRYKAATSIGVRPTFKDSEHAMETFILDFQGDLYKKQIRIEFVSRLRDEVKFDSIQGLQEQIDRDVNQTRAILQESRLGAS